MTFSKIIFTSLVYALLATVAQGAQPMTEQYFGRDAIVYAPSQASAYKALVVVLHGGLGNASRISSMRSESGLNLNAVADRGGFIVAYLNGTPVTRILGADKLGWNAGNCCGRPVQKKVDDVAYIDATAKAIAGRYGIDPNMVFGVGHSNGAMMVQRMMCESSVFTSVAPISGPLGNGASSCPLARGKRILSIHGEDDRNVPIEGGRGSKGFSEATFASEKSTAQAWRASGASYDLQIIKGAEHSIDSINSQLQRQESQSLDVKLVRFFGLL
jgi:polyhydroxybutyrate depolymerase